MGTVERVWQTSGFILVADKYGILGSRRAEECWSISKIILLSIHNVTLELQGAMNRIW